MSNNQQETFGYINVKPLKNLANILGEFDVDDRQGLAAGVKMSFKAEQAMELVRYIVERVDAGDAYVKLDASLFFDKPQEDGTYKFDNQFSGKVTTPWQPQASNPTKKELTKQVL